MFRRLCQKTVFIWYLHTCLNGLATLTFDKYTKFWLVDFLCQSCNSESAAGFLFLLLNITDWEHRIYSKIIEKLSSIYWKIKTTKVLEIEDLEIKIIFNEPIAMQKMQKTAWKNVPCRFYDSWKLQFPCNCSAHKTSE